MSSFAKQIQRLVKEYRLAGQVWPASKGEIAEWALSVGKYDISPAVAKRVLANEIGRALREEYITDTKGRRIRVKYSAKVRRKEGEPPLTLWGDVRTEPMSFLRVAHAGRRNGIVAEARQWYNDGRFINETHPNDEQLPLILNFTRDVEELNQGNVA